jgi:CRISPR-associated protein Csd1
MILQSLSDYYVRSDDLAATGWEWKRIPYIIELKRDGTFVQLTSLKTGKKTTEVTPSLVPKAEIRSGTRAYEHPNALWDHIGFLLGQPKSEADSDKETANNQLHWFRRRIVELSTRRPESVGLAAIRQFYERHEYRRVSSDPLWQECSKLAGCNMTFRLTDEIDLIVQDAAVQSLFSETLQGTDETNAVCLVSGETGPIQQLHFPISGVCEKPAPLSAINDGRNPAFASFGKHQGLNFPVSQQSVFQYTTALNHLLRPGSRQRMQVGDASAVFWAQKADDADMEAWFSEIFAEADDPDARTEQIRALFDAMRSGRFDGARGSDRFFVLGLAPNAARIAVRFWHVAPLADIAQRTRAWFDDLSIVRGPNDPEFPSLFRLLLAAAVLNKADNIPPNLGGDVMRSALNGTPLPTTLLQASLQRCRADQAKKTDTGKPVAHVSYHRAAILKACLNRLINQDRLHGKEIAVSLDITNTEPAYLLGRLFAAYERIQSDAAGRDLNRTVRDTYFGAAMNNPASVFPRLIQLNQHHMRDLKRNSPGLHVVRDRLVGEIWDGLRGDAALPPNQPLAERARYALGYYHQRQDFFRKSVADSSMSETNQGGT